MSHSKITFYAFRLLLILVILSLYSVQVMAVEGVKQVNNQLANPASVFCEEHGGRLEIRSDETAGGDEFGICVFADGSECGEWLFYRGACISGGAVQGTNPISTYCKDHGGISKILTDENGVEQRLCIFTDQSWCNQWDFYRNKCKRGHQ